MFSRDEHLETPIPHVYQGAWASQDDFTRIESCGVLSSPEPLPWTARSRTDHLSSLFPSFPQLHSDPGPVSPREPACVEYRAQCLAHGRFCHEVTVLSPLVECVDRAGSMTEEEMGKLSTFLC